MCSRLRSVLRVIQLRFWGYGGENLDGKTKVLERLKMNLDLRDSAEDSSQRMQNAIEPGSVLPRHRHQKISETMACLRGEASDGVL